MALRSLKASLIVALATSVVAAVTPAGGARLDAFAGITLHNALMVVAGLMVAVRVVAERSERAAWICVGVALVTYAAGEIVWNSAFATLDEPPYPSIADALWLTFYPASYAGIVLLSRARFRELNASVWLDGLVGALVVAALGATLVFPTVLDATEGDAAAVATTLAYPLGDLMLLGIVVGVFALTGWRPGRGWVFIGAGLATNAVADSIYTYQSAKGTWVDGSIFDVLFPLAALLIAWSAWQPAGKRAPALDGRRVLVVPSAFMLGALALMGYGLFAGVNELAAALLLAAGLAIVVRFALTFREYLAMLALTRNEATTDPLTGLANRRALMRDLPAIFERATPEEPRALALFDLNGFKRYNDTFGHPAGDALLVRLGASLSAMARPFGCAYRLGGDEFCLLIERAAQMDAVIAAASQALTEQGEGFEVSSSHGKVLLPAEAADPRDALQLADQRMYAQKDGRPSGAGRQTRDVLLGVLRERQPELHDHLRGVATLAHAVGERLGMGSEELDVVTRAAELHDIGKMGVPDAILSKPGPLDEQEWSFMRRHTIIGERILGAAEALRPVARIVRSSHERFDGAGYPDRLAGEDIPLGARVVFACDAFDAMVSRRPYAPPSTAERALAELRSCAGSQFDPAVVEALEGVAAEKAPVELSTARRPS